MQFLRDTWLIYRFALRATLRNSVFVFIGFFNPLCYLFLFMPLLQGLAKAGYFEGGQTFSFFLTRPPDNDEHVRFSLCRF